LGYIMKDKGPKKFKIEKWGISRHPREGLLKPRLKMIFPSQLLIFSLHIYILYRFKIAWPGLLSGEEPLGVPGRT
jgi:hypothetical protein